MKKVVAQLVFAALFAQATVLEVHAQAGLNDSTTIKPATTLKASACPALTATTYQWYPTVPSGWAIEGGGTCVNVAAKQAAQAAADKAATAQAAQAAAEQAATAQAAQAAQAAAQQAALAAAAAPPTVSLTVPAIAVMGSSFTATWSATGTPTPTTASIGCYRGTPPGALLAAWSVNSSPALLAVQNSMLGSDICIATVVSSSGKTEQSPNQSMIVNCPAGQVVSGSSCSEEQVGYTAGQFSCYQWDSSLGYSPSYHPGTPNVWYFTNSTGGTVTVKKFGSSGFGPKIWQNGESFNVNEDPQKTGGDFSSGVTFPIPKVYLSNGQVLQCTVIEGPWSAPFKTAYGFNTWTRPALLAMLP